MDEITLNRWTEARDFALSHLATWHAGSFGDWYMRQAVNRPLGGGMYRTEYPKLTVALVARFLTEACQ